MKNLHESDFISSTVAQAITDTSIYSLIGGLVSSSQKNVLTSITIANLHATAHAVLHILTSGDATVSRHKIAVPANSVTTHQLEPGIVSAGGSCIAVSAVGSATLHISATGYKTN
jgi:hypothetical protein